MCGKEGRLISQKIMKKEKEENKNTDIIKKNVKK